MHKFFQVAALGGIITVAGYGYYNFESQKSATESVVSKGKAVSKAPDFTAYTDVNEKKHAFFSYLKPGIALENLRIEKERERLVRLKENLESGLMSDSDIDDAKRLSHLYQVEMQGDVVTSDWIDNMLHRVDVIPEALVLTQAANESAWGTSRFARTAKNYFGQWCYSKGCGVVPLQRSEGMTHEVAKFKSVQESIHRYFMNVNRNQAYFDLREIRFQLREDGADLLSMNSAMEMSNGLLKYSERGEDYIQDLQAMMRHNEQFWTN
ncbi:glucosaminidase domain-containing protein [Vibrio diazotrophicus]|uniref:glucosaminidase domain-containing protein n=1 Tax=Vibrio diazotrophicus TaxID=685 RepID=UPI000C9EB032|nr:glucosaminidase domain-containing protein [Vibrio diazotrophicus]PNH82357.1 glucosaminidase [Vibrio diazotrophicus]